MTYKQVSMRFWVHQDELLCKTSYQEHWTLKWKPRGRTWHPSSRTRDLKVKTKRQNMTSILSRHILPKVRYLKDLDFRPPEKLWAQNSFCIENVQVRMKDLFHLCISTWSKRRLVKNNGLWSFSLIQVSFLDLNMFQF